MLSTFPPSKSSGFSLVELMVVIAIFAITMTFGVSSYRVWIQNTQIRNAAESIQNGLQRARGESVKRNGNVAFTLGANSSWTITNVADGTVIESRSGNEGSKNVTRSVLPVGATTITYTNLGIMTTNADASLSLSQIDLNSLVLAQSSTRNLRLVIGVMGNVKMCDPLLPAGSAGGC